MSESDKAMSYVPPPEFGEAFRRALESRKTRPSDKPESRGAALVRKWCDHTTAEEWPALVEKRQDLLTLANAIDEEIATLRATVSTVRETSKLRFKRAEAACKHLERVIGACARVQRLGCGDQGSGCAKGPYEALCTSCFGKLLLDELKVTNEARELLAEESSRG